MRGFKLGFGRRAGGGGGVPPEATLDAGTWDTAYTGPAAAHSVTGTITVSGLPYGLSADTSGGLLTITGTPS